VTRSRAIAILLVALLDAGCASPIDVVMDPDQCVSFDAGTTGRACTRNDQCAAEEYCAGDGCGTAGVCNSRCGVRCGGTDFVCGCDGVTYTSTCAAIAVGVRIAGGGVCGTPPGASGTSDAGGANCTDDSQCDTGWFCAGQCGGVGNCQLKPTACGDEVNPVCGCDGVLYRNGCLAALAGQPFDLRTPSTGCSAHGR
jgi:hypothetical protein